MTVSSACAGGNICSIMSIVFPSFLKVCACVVRLAQKAEVVCAVVQSVAVDVVHRCKVLRIGIRAKGLCHNATDKPITRLPATAKVHTLISLVVHEGVQNARLCVFEGFDAPARTDKIARIAFYCAPCFTR